MSGHTDFEQSMRKWTILDNKIRATSQELKTMRSQKLAPPFAIL